MNNDGKSKKQYIKELKEKAANVKLSIGKYKKRRPVVIEFSGAPKSGKTSSINSLMQFLKRNDFKVKVLPESASVCPVKDKHSPMFNLWTACDSIKSLVGELEAARMKYDVIILDRGIFDSMCWFQWLLNNDKMEQEMKTIMDRFLTMNELVSYIDLVFVFKAQPQVSIDREYASLLTDIPGSIMNEKVLKEYLKAVEITEKQAAEKKWFREIHSIETSDKDQNTVGVEVTESTLRVLQELFEEKIGYFELSELVTDEFLNVPCISFEKFESLGGIPRKLQFELRSEIEYTDGYIQPIPIAVLKDIDTGYVLMTKKAPNATSERSNERDTILPYVGGHIRQEDVNGSNENDFLGICKSALKREIREELGISVSLDDMVPDLFYVRDGSHSNNHMAVCFVLYESKETIKIRMESEELLSNRGKGKSGTFVEPQSIVKNVNSWGRIILKKYFQTELEVDQISMFDLKE